MHPSLAGIHRQTEMTLVNNSASICFAVSLKYSAVSFLGHSIIQDAILDTELQKNTDNDLWENNK